jgi:hypothetical protein
MCGSKFSLLSRGKQYVMGRKNVRLFEPHFLCHIFACLISLLVPIERAKIIISQNMQELSRRFTLPWYSSDIEILT